MESPEDFLFELNMINWSVNYQLLENVFHCILKTSNRAMTS